jgi:hypothetical protein
METSNHLGLSGRLRTDNAIVPDLRAAGDERDVEGYCYHDTITRQTELAPPLPYGVHVTLSEADAAEAATRSHPALRSAGAVQPHDASLPQV